MDLSFKTPQGRFNYRACAVIIDNGRILAMRDQRAPYYYLPGGRVKMGETAECAVMRELWEELHITPKIVRPLWLNQAFFTEDVDGQAYHELCLYFLVDISGTDILSKGQRFPSQEGAHTHDFVWLPWEQLQAEYFYPLFLKREIFHLPDSLILRTEWQ